MTDVRALKDAPVGLPSLASGAGLASGKRDALGKDRLTKLRESNPIWSDWAKANALIRILQVALARQHFQIQQPWGSNPRPQSSDPCAQPTELG